MDSADSMPAPHKALEFSRVTAEWAAPLGVFFEELARAGEERFFHPHPLTSQEAVRIATRQGLDLYYVMTEGGTVLGYGMLRGWDDGYDTPSLGIALAPSCRGQGLGRLFMLVLHAAAHRRGSRRIRLKVYAENQAATDLYLSLGYRFESSAGELVGTVEL